MHKIIHGNAPPLLVKRFKENNSRHTHVLSLPRPNMTLCKTSLAYSGGWLWNNLPNFLRNISSLSKFKKKYVQYLTSMSNCTRLQPTMFSHS